MKRNVLLAIIILALCMCLACCNTVDVQHVNELLKADYSALNITVTTSTTATTLTSVFNVTCGNDGTTVDCVTQRYDVIDVNNPPVASEPIVTERDSFKSDGIKLSALCFDNGTFGNMSDDGSTFIGKVANGKAYLGVDYDCNNFVISIAYTTVLNSVTMSYELADGTCCTVVCTPVL